MSIFASSSEAFPLHIPSYQRFHLYPFFPSFLLAKVDVLSVNLWGNTPKDKILLRRFWWLLFMKLLKVKIPKVWEWQGMLSGNRIKDIISTRGCKKSVGGGEEKGPGLIYCESLLLQLLQPRWPETKLAKAKVDLFRPILTKYVKIRASVNNAKDRLFRLKKGITYLNVITMGQSTINHFPVY